MNITPKYPLEREILQGYLSCLSCWTDVLKSVQPTGLRVYSVCSSAEPHVKNLVWFCSNTSKGHNPITKESLGLMAVVLIQTSIRNTYPQAWVSWVLPELLLQTSVHFLPVLVSDMQSVSPQKWDETCLFHYINHLPSHCLNRLSNQFCPGPGAVHFTWGNTSSPR